MIGVDRQIRNTRPDQGGGHAPPRQPNTLINGIPPVEIEIFLRPHHTNRGDRRAIHQIALIGLVPAEDWLCGAVLTPIFVVRTDMMPPGLDRAGKAFERPHARFRLGLAGDAEGRLPTLVHGHAFGDQLVPAQQTVDQLTHLTVALEALRRVAHL